MECAADDYATPPEEPVGSYRDGGSGRQYRGVEAAARVSRVAVSTRAACSTCTTTAARWREVLANHALAQVAVELMTANPAAAPARGEVRGV